MVNNKRFLSLIIVCFVLGFMVALQIKTTHDALKTSTQYQRLENLADILLRTEQERDALKQQVTKMKANFASNLDIPANVEFLAGTTAVKGPGVEIYIEDSKKVISNKDDTNLYIIHDEDILKVINELKAAGAEAIAINDQRLTSISELRCAGPTITVNNTRIAAPYIIKAIGDISTMENAIKMRGGVADSLSVWGIQLNVKPVNNLIIPAYKGVVQFKYLQSIDK